MALSPGPNPRGPGDLFLPPGGAGADGPGRGPLRRNRPGDAAAQGLAHSAPEPGALPRKAPPGVLAHRHEPGRLGLRVGGAAAVGPGGPGRAIPGFRLGRALWGERRGFVGAVVLATCGGYVVLARLLTLDMVFTLFLNLGIALGYLALSRERPRLWTWAYLALALAVLVKGPVALVLAGLICGMGVISAAALEIPAAAPGAGSCWPSWCCPGSGTGMALSGVPPLFHLGTPFGALPDPGYSRRALLVLWTGAGWGCSSLVGCIPWALFPRGEGRDGPGFLMIWAGVVLVFFSLSRGKLGPTFCRPCAPGLTPGPASGRSNRFFGDLGGRPRPPD